MTEQFLDDLQVDAILDQPGSVSIPQVVESENIKANQYQTITLKKSPLCESILSRYPVQIFLAIAAGEKYLYKIIPSSFIYELHYSG
jgi:hypothetical protein